MRIAGLPPVLQQTLLAALPKVEEGFRATAASAEASAAPAAPAAAPVVPSPTTSVQMLVALAAAEPVAERRRKLAARAEHGLSMLERLHAELVTGVAAPERLHELVEWADSFEAPEDSQLASLAEDIELRVRVELAKHDLRA